MATFYNDHEPYVCEWLRNLIRAGHIGDGTVDQREIQTIRPDELAGYERCHFFAGIAGWELALNIAGWPPDEPVWTGSCPCQPFSDAGKHQGFNDERHLWPDWFELIRQCRPAAIFGEQVASKAGRLWLDRVRSDLEGVGYAVGAADLCAAGFGAPNIRQRLWWVAYAESGRFGINRSTQGTAGHAHERSATGGMADSKHAEWWPEQQTTGTGSGRAGSGRSGRMGNAVITRLERYAGYVRHRNEPGRLDAEETGSVAAPGGSDYWADYKLVHCTDGKARRIEPGTFPLAHGVPARVGKLRAYGNAINPWVAAEFIRAFMESKADVPNR